MPTATLSQTIEAPAEEVFAVVSDVATYEQWNPTVTSSRVLSEGDVANGTRFEFAIKRMGAQEMEVTNFESGRSIRFEPRSNMMGGGHRFTLSEMGGSTRLDHEVVMEPKGVFRLMSPFIGMMAKRNLRKTADALEARVRASRGAS